MHGFSMANAFKFGPKHFNNVRNSINFAFNSSRMTPPANVKNFKGTEALESLKHCCKQFELLYCLQGEQVQLSKVCESAGYPANSPYGAWMSLNFPIGESISLRNQYKMLDLNTLRMGKVLEVVDLLSYDSCEHYI